MANSRYDSSVDDGEDFDYGTLGIEGVVDDDSFVNYLKENDPEAYAELVGMIDDARKKENDYVLSGVSRPSSSDRLDVGNYLDMDSINDAIEMDEAQKAYDWAKERGIIGPSWVAENDPYYWSVKVKRGHQVGTNDGIYEVVDERSRKKIEAIEDLLFGYDKDGYESEVSAPEMALMFTSAGLPYIAGRTAYDLASGNRQPGILDAVFGLGGLGRALRAGKKASRFARNLDYSMKARAVDSPYKFARELYREAVGPKIVVPKANFNVPPAIEHSPTMFTPYEIVE